MSRYSRVPRCYATMHPRDRVTARTCEQRIADAAASSRGQRRCMQSGDWTAGIAAAAVASLFSRIKSLLLLSSFVTRVTHASQRETMRGMFRWTFDSPREKGKQRSDRCAACQTVPSAPRDQRKTDESEHRIKSKDPPLFCSIGGS